MSLVLENEGTLLSRVTLNLKDPSGVYNITCAEGTKALMPLDPIEDTETSSKNRSLSVVVPMGTKAEFLVEFTPNTNGRLVGEIKLSVIDNPYEESSIQLIGEGYEDDITIDNIRSAREIEDDAASSIEIADNVTGKS